MDINVFVVMQQLSTYRAVQLLAEKTPDIELIGYANNEQEAISQIVKLSPDVVVLASALPEPDGIETVQEILRRCPSSRIVILARGATNAHLLKALQAGAKGYLQIESMEAELVQAILSAFAGHRYINRKLWGELIDDYVLQCESNSQNPPAYPGLREDVSFR
jgi:DNA-binding NarL/FixJ family response regulator